MKIDVMISANHINKEEVMDKTVVVIDILRATSVITTAINNGCKEVIPVIEIEEALIMASEGECILGGERKALKIDGFNCSNSPLEYTKDIVNNKRLIMTTSNGTKAIKRCEGAKNILIGAMINAKAVSKKVLNLQEGLVIVNAGTYGQFSIDDFICSGYIIHCILEQNHQVELTDIAKTALFVYRQSSDLSFIKEATHYNRIEELGLLDDLKYCCKKDIIDIVPEYADGRIK
ncbi:2-phosphosulfolactate phosphatase family protein [uncultured Clostridium sp.]|uniref:2-phosphosulfolactate phosphatase family protein n=1 Tax=uncultured Clostridium sp. TaxID=59620 RepID=UPI0028E81A1D|nr:2-phosphosulfolactate phosphatase family protein [uncultured Clostridium sp.]